MQCRTEMVGWVKSNIKLWPISPFCNSYTLPDGWEWKWTKSSTVDKDVGVWVIVSTTSPLCITEAILKK